MCGILINPLIWHLTTVGQVPIALYHGYDTLGTMGRGMKRRRYNESLMATYFPHCLFMILINTVTLI